MAEPSIAMIPSGYKAEKIYSVLPTNGNADLDFARNSKATRINEQGLIEEMAVNVPLLDYSDGTCPSLKLQPQSTNLITYSESFGNSYWTKSGASIEGDASTAGVENVVNGSFTGSASSWVLQAGWAYDSNNVSKSLNSSSYLKQSDILTVGKTYLITFTISNYVGGYFGINSTFWGQDTNYSANGTYTIQGTTKNASLYLFSNSAFVGSIDNISVKEVSGFSAPSVDSPLGAFKLVESSGNSRHYVEMTGFGATAGDFSNSVYVKSFGRNKIGLRENAATGKYASFDLSTETVLDTSGISANIKLISDGWYRIDFTTLTSTSIRFGIELLPNSYTTGVIHNGYTGDGTSGVYIFGAQLEQGSYSTSLINTQGTVQTRLADTCSQTVPDGVIGQTEGVWYWEGIINNTNTEFQILNSTRSTSNTISLSRQTLNRVRARIWSAGVLNVDIVSTSNVFLNTKSKIAISYKSGNTNVFYNGVLVGSSNNSFSFNGDINEIELSVFVNYFGASLNTNKTNQVLIYKEQLTDSECIALTTL